MKRSALLNLGMSFGILFFSQALNAQFGTGEISGVVTDPSGAAIAQAEIKIRNESNGQTKTILTDDQGRYTGLGLVTGSHVAVNVVLQLGSVNETVEVAGSAAQVETLSAQVGKVVEGRLFQDIPLNGRNPTSMLLLKAGVSSTAAANA